MRVICDLLKQLRVAYKRLKFPVQRQRPPVPDTKAKTIHFIRSQSKILKMLY